MRDTQKEKEQEEQERRVLFFGFFEKFQGLIERYFEFLLANRTSTFLLNALGMSGEVVLQALKNNKSQLEQIERVLREVKLLVPKDLPYPNYDSMNKCFLSLYENTCFRQIMGDMITSLSLEAQKRMQKDEALPDQSELDLMTDEMVVKFIRSKYSVIANTPLDILNIIWTE